MQSIQKLCARYKQEKAQVKDPYNVIHVYADAYSGVQENFIQQQTAPSFS